jgi:hypothetical protein
MFNEDLEDRKDVRREHINSKKTHVSPDSRNNEVKKTQKKINRQYRNRKVDLEQEEKWENWKQEYK